MAKLNTVTAEVHKKVGKGYRVKVLMPEIGIFINGMMVYPPSEEHNYWSVYPPSHRAGRGKYAYIVEFNKKFSLWEEIYDECVDAVKVDPQYKQEQVKDVVLEDIDNEPIDYSAIPFD